MSRARKRRWPILRWLAALLLTVGLGAAESAPRFSERPEDLDQVIAISQLNLTDPVEETADRRRLLYVALTRSKRRAGVIFM